MRSNYKRLGDYIERCDEFNEGMQVQDLLGISNNKYFQKSHTNIIGIDLTKYRVVRSYQFAFNRATTRNGDKISIALRRGGDCIVSPSYRIFKSRDESVLNSEYLMMWFNRPEFDRYARFKSHGSAHEFFDWEEMCEVDIPIPSAEEQLKIVKEYNVIQNRIKLNNELITKLDETAQAIYKQWFIDFEFPDENGLPYKSNGGEMEWCEEIKKEIPRNWKTVKLSELIEFKNGKLKPTKKGLYPLYGGNGIIDFVETYNFKDIIAIGRVGAYCGSLYRVKDRCWISDNAICAVSKKTNNNMFCFELLKTLSLNERSEGTGQPLLTQGILNSIETIKPNDSLMEYFEELSNALFDNLCFSKKDIELLTQLKLTLLSKMTKIETEEIEA